MANEQNNADHTATNEANRAGDKVTDDKEPVLEEEASEIAKAGATSTLEPCNTGATDESSEQKASLKSLQEENLSLKQGNESLRQVADENLQKAMRAQAELENIHKRSRRDIANAHKYGLEQFVSVLLPVLDSMELGVSAADDAKNASDLHEGMQLTLKMFCDCIEKSGVQQVNPQLGDIFNPEQHEAVNMQASDKVESGAIVEVMQKGYELNGRLLRPAMVTVAK